MACQFHPNARAVARCEECGAAICGACKMTIDRGHTNTSAGGFAQTEHSYHTVCPECQKKFKGKVSALKIVGLLALVALLAFQLIRGQM
jgi:hypothetical protein